MENTGLAPLPFERAFLVILCGQHGGPQMVIVPACMHVLIGSNSHISWGVKILYDVGNFCCAIMPNAPCEHRFLKSIHGTEAGYAGTT